MRDLLCGTRTGTECRQAIGEGKNAYLVGRESGADSKGAHGTSGRGGCAGILPLEVVLQCFVTISERQISASAMPGPDAHLSKKRSIGRQLLIGFIVVERAGWASTDLQRQPDATQRRQGPTWKRSRIEHFGEPCLREEIRRTDAQGYSEAAMDYRDRAGAVTTRRVSR
jgi:hypothetical protein